MPKLCGLRDGAKNCGVKFFESFYTTKQDVGTGLELWVSREIVQKHGGNITLRSSVAAGHSGTVFSIFLPE